MRLEITRRSDLALRALRHLAAAAAPTDASADRGDTDPARVPGARLADAIGTSRTFLPQVMGPLVEQGWVDSEPGPRGGYRLVADPATISVLAVIEAVEGVTDDGRCVLRGGPCAAGTSCALHEAWTRGRTALLEALDATVVWSR